MRRRSALAFGVLLASASCGDDDVGGGGGVGQGGTGGSGGAPPDPITLLPDGWNKIAPGGETRCGDGSDWAFFVRKGTTNRLVLELQGGGSCWDETTCFVDRKAVTWLRTEPDLADDASNAGIHDHASAANPFAEWHHVIVSYCTGDVHWGSRDAKYGAHAFFHRGAINMRAVLDWAATNVPAPEQVLVTGHSAGSLGSIMWAPWVARQYPSAAVVQLGDSAAGVYPAGAIAIIREAWNAEAAMPTFVDGTDPASITDLASLYRLAARGYPSMRLSEVTSAFDLDQTQRWAYVGGDDARAFTTEMRSKLNDVASTVPLFRSYVFAGSTHTITNRQETYTVTSSGVPFRDWLAALVDGELPSSVDCAPECGGPLVGDLDAAEEWACLEGGTLPAPTTSTFDVTLRLTAGPYELLEVDDAWRLGGLEVRACARDDADCAAPLDEGLTSAAGEIILTLPAGTNGFDGYFRVSGPEVMPSRVYAWPPIVSGGAWLLNGHSVGLESPGSAETISSRAGQTLDTTKGQLRVGLVDCAQSYTSRASVALDGAAPDAFLTESPLWVEDARSPRAIFVNVEPGEHTIAYVADETGAEEATLSVVVEAGTITSVVGFGPRP